MKINMVDMNYMIFMFIELNSFYYIYYRLEIFDNVLFRKKVPSYGIDRKVLNERVFI